MTRRERERDETLTETPRMPWAGLFDLDQEGRKPTYVDFSLISVF
jgi:hypothetical protein